MTAPRVPPRIVVDPDSGVAPWRQVRDQLLHLVRTGALPVGSRLPAIRQLAGDLGLAAGTVARVYRDLEADGVLRTARRQGTVVAAVPADPVPADPVPADPRPTDARPVHTGPVHTGQLDADTALALAAAEYAARAAGLGADPRTAAAAVYAAWPADPQDPPPAAGPAWHDHVCRDAGCSKRG